MPMRWSSTTLARWYVGKPSDFMRTWSSTLLCEKVTSPRSSSRKAGLALGGDFEADDGGPAFGLEGGDLLGRKLAVGSVVAGRELGGELRFAQGFELLGGLEGLVGGAVVEQDLDVLAVDFGAFGLAVWTVWAADVGALVPGEAEPVEGVEDLLLGRGDEAGAVGVLDAQDELAAALAGVDVVEQADVGGAYVGVAGGGRGDADADGRSSDLS